MSIFEGLYYRNRALALTEELKDLDASYKGMVKAHEMGLAREQALQKLLHESEASLKRSLQLGDEIGELAQRMQAERDEARAEVDDVRAALVWLEDKWFRKGGVA